MKAVRIHEHGSADVLRWEEIQKIECPQNKIRVKIKAAALNHLDIWIRNGLPGFSLPLPLIMGSDGAGIITEVGSQINDFKPGDEIVVQPNRFCGQCDACVRGQENYCQQYGILGETENGVQASEVILDPINIYSKPHHLTFEEAASMPLVFLTAYQMIVKRAQLQSGETMLVYGATSGVGSAAIQIGKFLHANVIATVGDNKKIKHAEKMGADLVINHHQEDWHKLLKGKEINVIFEHIGPATWPYSMRLLAKGGRLVTCGATTGPKVEIDLRHLFSKQQSILGSTMSDLNTFREVLDLIHVGHFFPFVDKIFPFSQVIQAHQRMERREQFGKIVLSSDAQDLT